MYSFHKPVDVALPSDTPAWVGRPVTAPSPVLRLMFSLPLVRHASLGGPAGRGSVSRPEANSPPPRQTRQPGWAGRWRLRFPSGGSEGGLTAAGADPAALPAEDGLQPGGGAARGQPRRAGGERWREVVAPALGTAGVCFVWFCVYLNVAL